jgi:hypothetical protein
LLINAALPEFMINKTAEQMQTNGRFNFTFNGYGSPVNNVDFSNGLAKLGLQLYSSTSNTKDPISELLGGNYGLYHVDLQPKLDNTNESLFSPTRYGSVRNLGLFGNDKYDEGKDKNKKTVAQEVSPHSSYTCAGKCGLDGLITPTLDELKQSMAKAIEANNTYDKRKKLLEEKQKKASLLPIVPNSAIEETK